MLCPPLSLALALLAASLLPGSVGLCGRPGWAAVAWDVLPDELEQPGTGTEHQCSCLPYPLDQLWSHCAQLQITAMMLQGLSLCSQALGLLSGLLLARWLWRKVMSRQRQVSAGGDAGGTVPGCWEQGTAKALGQGCLEGGGTKRLDEKALAEPGVCSASFPGLFLPPGGRGWCQPQRKKWGHTAPAGFSLPGRKHTRAA